MVTTGFVIVGLLILNSLFDLYHLLNNMLLLLYSECSLYFFPRKWRFHLLDENSMYNVCLTTDLDFLLHMNNARYLRDCDFAKTKLWFQNSIGKALRKTGGTMVLGGTVSRYRKPITLFTVYIIKSRVLYWDSKAFYIEQRFVRWSDGFVCCEVVAKMSLIGVTMEELFDTFDYQVTRPECPDKVAKWIEYNELSSTQLRKEKAK